VEVSHRLFSLLYRIQRWRWSLSHPLTVGVRLLPIQSEAILLVRHTYQARWYIPGGGVRKRETLEEAIRREAQEELGATLGDLELFGVYTNFYEGKSDHVIVFLCTAFSLTGQTDREIERFARFPLDQLPADLSPGTRRRVVEYLAGDFPNFGVW